MNSVNHFEIPADDVQRATKFYNQVFGWQTNQITDDTTLVTTAPSNKNGVPNEPGSINGDISNRGGHLTHPVIVISVDSIEEHTKKIETAGGKSLMDKVPMQDMGFYTLVSDSEGNTIGLWESA